MRKINRPCEVLEKTPLFEGLERSVFQYHCSVTKLRAFNKGEIIAAQGDECQSIGIIDSGQIAMQKYTSGGDFSTISLLGPGDYFGEDLIFGTNGVYTFTLEAMSPCDVLFVSKDTLKALLESSQVVLFNFLKILSDRIHTQNRRVALLSQRTLRHKIATYLLELREEQCSKDVSEVTVELPVSKEVVSKLLAMPRPSFSRELIAMERDNLVKVNGRYIQLLNINALEEDIMEEYNLA